ncbi:MAG TPA: hypothetical protein VI297_08150 [Gemmatimonadales bacterium]
MHPNTRSPLLLPALAAAALGLAACTSAPTTGPTTPALSQAEANAAADVIVSDMSDQTDGATSTSSSPSFSRTAAPATTPSLAVAATGAWYFTACSPAPTVTVNGSTTSYVFNNCTISRLVPLETLTRNGQVDVTLGAGSRTVVFTNFEKTWQRVFFRTGQEVTTSATLNGTRSISDDGTTLQHHVYGTGDPASSFFQTDYVFADQSTAEHQRNWQGPFTADVASSIVVDQPLPAGMWSVTGNSTFTRNQGTASQKVWTFSTTGSGVHYNPACTSAPQFDAGTLTVQAANAQTGTTTTFTITFTACGQYTATMTKS